MDYAQYAYVCIRVFLFIEKNNNFSLLKNKCTQNSYTYPLLLKVNISNAKIILFQQAVIVADVIYEKLTFRFPLQKEKELIYYSAHSNSLSIITLQQSIMKNSS